MRFHICAFAEIHSLYIALRYLDQSKEELLSIYAPIPACSGQQITLHHLLGCLNYLFFLCHNGYNFSLLLLICDKYKYNVAIKQRFITFVANKGF